MSPDPMSDWPVVIEQAVLWGEMDANRHINNVAYFRYFETARIAYAERLGWLDLERETGVGLILHSVQARFRRPLTYPDTILIGVRRGEMGEDRFTMLHQIYSRSQDAIVTEGSGIVVAFDYNANRKVALPSELRHRIEELERRG